MKPIHTIIHSADSEAVGIWWNCDFSLSQWSPQSGGCDGIDLRWYNYTVRDSGYSSFTTNISAWLKCMLGMIGGLMCVLFQCEQDLIGGLMFVVSSWPVPDRWSPVCSFSVTRTWSVVSCVCCFSVTRTWSVVSCLCVVSAWPGPDRWSHVCCFSVTRTWSVVSSSCQTSSTQTCSRPCSITRRSTKSQSRHFFPRRRRGRLRDKKRSCRKCVNLLELLLAVWRVMSKILEQCVYYHEKIQRHHLVKSTPACSY